MKHTTIIMLTLMLTLLIAPTFITPALAAPNDPGHDTLYIEQSGDSELTGNLNISDELRVANLFWSDFLYIIGNGSTATNTKPNVYAIDNNNLYINAPQNIYLAKDAGSTVYIGGSSVDLNVSGDITSRGIAVCLANGTNCINGNNSGNVSSISAGNGISVSATTGDITVSANAAACGASQYSYWSGTAWLCRDDANDGSGGYQSSAAGWTNTSSTTSTSLNVSTSQGLNVGSGASGASDGQIAVGKAYSNHGGYGNALDLNGGISLNRANDASYSYLLSSFSSGGQMLSSIYVTPDTGNALIIENRQSGKDVYLKAYNSSGTSQYIINANSDRTYVYGKGSIGLSVKEGGVGIGISSADPTAQLEVQSGSSSRIGAIVQGAASQSANLQEWQNSGGTPLAYVNGSGTIYDAGGQVCTAANGLCLTVGDGTAGWTNDSSTTSTSLSVNVALNAFFVNSTNGRIGVGTNAPNAAMDIRTGDVYILGSSNRRFLIGDSASSGQWGGFRWDTSTDTISFGHSASSSTVQNIVIDGTGRVGINDSTPTTTLDVTGNIGIGGTEVISSGRVGTFAAGTTVDSSAVCTIANGYCNQTSQDLSTAGGWTNTSTITSTDLNVDVTTGNLSIDSGYLSIGSAATLYNSQIYVKESTAGQSAIIMIDNTDNTNSNSQSAIWIRTGGANAGDARIAYTINGQGDWQTGIDNSDSDAYKISTSTTFAGTSPFTLTRTGRLGLNTNSPGEILEVAGNINSTGGDICITGGKCLSTTGTGTGDVESVLAGDATIIVTSSGGPEPSVVVNTSNLDSYYFNKTAYPNMDTDSTDDFDGAWSSLTGVPAGFADDVDNDTTYSDLNEFTDSGNIYQDDIASTSCPYGVANITDDGTVTCAAQQGTGTGNISSSTTSTNNAIARWDGATGLVVQNSGVTIDDNGDITITGGDINGPTGSYIDISEENAEGFTFSDNTGSYPDFYCKGSSGSNTYCDFKSGVLVSGGILITQSSFYARGGISDDGGNLELNDDVNISGTLNAVGASILRSTLSIGGNLDFNSNDITDIGNIYTNDGTTNFFSGGCGDNEHITGISSAGVISCAANTATGTGSMNGFIVTADSGTDQSVNNSETLTFTGGTNITTTVGATNTITINHADTSGASSVDNSNGNVVQDVSIDGNGHVTGLASTDLDNRYAYSSYLSGRTIADANDADNAGLTTYYMSSGGANKPTGTDHAYLTLGYSTAWATQMASDWRTNEWYVRTENSSTWTGWSKLWHSGNDGNSSGLDADTIDGNDYNSNWPTTLGNIQTATTSDFHNIGGTDATDDSVSGGELDGVFSTTGILVRTGASTYSTITDDSATWDAKAGTGTCAAGTVVQNTTTGGVSCVPVGTGSMDNWLLGAENTAGTQTISNGNMVNFTDGTGISVTRSGANIIITNTGDTNAGDDFDGAWSSLSGVPAGFADNVDNDTTYSDLSEFADGGNIYQDDISGSCTYGIASIDDDGTVNCATQQGVGDGNVSSSTTSTNNAIARWDGTTGLVVQNSGVTIDDSNQVGGFAKLTATTDTALPSLTMDSSSSGDTWTSQGAYIALGEQASTNGAAATYISYIGNGYGYIGSGALASGIPGASYLRFSYNSDNIYTPDVLDVGGITEGSSNTLSNDISGNAATVTNGIYTTSTWTGGDLSGTGLAPQVIDDSHEHDAANITSGTLPSARISGSYTGLTGVGTITTGTWQGTDIAVNQGGTGAATADNALINLGAAKAATCAAGTVVQNTTTGGVSCVAVGSGDGTITSITAGTGLTGGIITSTGTIALNTTYTDNNYLRNNGDSASGNYTFDSTTLHIDSTNNRIGIGTTTPSAGLDVRNGDVYIFGASNRRFLIGDSTSAGQWGGFRWDSGTDTISFGHSASSSTVQDIVIDGSGRIGINDSIPSHTLDVTGNIGIGGTEVISNSGTWTGTEIAVTKGGTGAATADNALINLGAAKAATCAAGSVVQNTTTGGVQCIGVGTGDGSVTSVSAGTGMSFTTITNSGSVAIDTSYFDTGYYNQTEYPNMDTNAADDFDGDYGSLTNSPTHLSNFTDDLGHVEDNTSWNQALADTLYDASGAAAARAGVGDCGAGEVVQNTTTGGVECVAVGSGDGSVTSVTAGDGMTQTGTASVNPTLNIESHAGSAGSIGTINISADAIGVNLGTTSTTAYRGDYGDTAYNDRLKWDGGSTGLTAATGRTSLGLVAGGTGDIWVEKAGDTMTGSLNISGSNKLYVPEICLDGNCVTSWPTGGGGGWSNSSTEVSLVDDNDNVSIGATPTLFVDTANGRVGVGTASPDDALHVNSSGNVNIDVSSPGVNTRVGLRMTNDAQSYRLLVDGAANDRFRILDVTGGGYFLEVEPGAPDNSLYIDSTGHVGIGTNNPTNELHVTGTINASVDVCLEDGTCLGSLGGGADLQAVTDIGATTTNAINITSTANPGLQVGNNANGYILVGGSVISDAGSDLILDADNGVVTTGTSDDLFVGGDVKIIGNNIKDSTAATRISLGETSNVGSTLYVNQSSGSVGIGTSSPTNALTIVSSPGVNTPILNITNTGDYSNSAILLLNNEYARNAGILIQTEGTDRWIMKVAGAADKELLFLNGSGSTALSIFQNGYVGIGTASPAENLHVATSDTSFAAALFTNSNSGATASDGLAVGYSNAAYIWNYENTNLQFATNNAARMTIQNDGLVGIGIASPLYLLHLYNASNDVTIRVQTAKADGTSDIQFQNDARLWRVGTFGALSDAFLLQDVSGGGIPIQVEAGAPTNALYLDSAGQVGINTVPSYDFHAVGISNANNFRFTGYGSLSGEQDVFWIEDTDVGGGGQDESSVLTVYKSSAFSAADDGSSVIDVILNNTGDDSLGYIYGRNVDDGAIQWGIDSNNDIWTSGGLDVGATGTDCGRTGAACHNSPAFVVESDGDVGIGVALPESTLNVQGTSQTAEDFDTTGSRAGIIQVEGGSGGVGSGGGILFGGYNDVFAGIRGYINDATGYGIGKLVFSTREATGTATLNNQMTIDYTGEVMIGTMTSGGNTEGNGDLYVLDELEYDGTLYGPGADLAEKMPASGELEASDVVVIDPENDEHVMRSSKAFDTRVAGVVSTDPAMIMSKDIGDTPIALAGRVPVKVNTENGPIIAGDYLVTSSVPGEAMACRVSEIDLNTPEEERWKTIKYNDRCRNAAFAKAMESSTSDGLITGLVLLN